MPPGARRLVSEEQYLALEREAEVRHELVGGEMVAMGGASAKHAAIILNVGAALRARLATALTNPLALVEVLSPSTESYDRGAKFAHYRLITSLRDYVLVSQAERRVEVFHRTGDGRGRSATR
jgi:Uma2 family endonuclease